MCLLVGRRLTVLCVTPSFCRQVLPAICVTSVVVLMAVAQSISAMLCHTSVRTAAVVDATANDDQSPLQDSVVARSAPVLQPLVASVHVRNASTVGNSP